MRRPCTTSRSIGIWLTSGHCEEQRRVDRPHMTLRFHPHFLCKVRSGRPVRARKEGPTARKSTVAYFPHSRLHLRWNGNLCRASSPITASPPTDRGSPALGSTPSAPPSPASSAPASWL